MSPEAFSAILNGCRGKKSITLFMPGIDPDIGLDIDPNKVIPAAAHPAFAELAGTPDAGALWLLAEEASSVGVGPLKIRFAGETTLIDSRLISAIDIHGGLAPTEGNETGSPFRSN